MDQYSRRALLAGAGTTLVGALAGCSDDDEEPGLYAVDVLILHRDGDRWYDFPGQVGVRVTVENTDVDTHDGTLVVRLSRSGTDEVLGTKERDVRLPGGTTKGYRIVFDVDATAEAEFTATADFEA